MLSLFVEIYLARNYENNFIVEAFKNKYQYLFSIFALSIVQNKKKDIELTLR